MVKRVKSTGSRASEKETYNQDVVVLSKNVANGPEFGFKAVRILILFPDWFAGDVKRLSLTSSLRQNDSYAYHRESSDKGERLGHREARQD